MNTLGPRFGLSPATMAGLAQVTGAQPPADPDGLTEADLAAGVRAPDGQTVASMSNSSAPSAPGKGDPNIIIGAGIGARQPPTKDPLAAPTAEAPTAEAEDEATAVRQGSAVPSLPTYTTPAHWQPGSHAVATQHGMDPGELEEGQYNRDVAAGYGLMAGDHRLEATKRNAQADALYAAAHAKASQDANARLAELNRQRDAYVQQERGRLEKLAADVQSAKVDPEAYWKDKGTLGRIVGAIAIGLGQFGASLRGGPNAALQIIQSGIDRNIDAQKSNIAAKKNAFDLRSSLYARNLQEFGDKEKAVLATKINYLDQVMGMVEAQRAVAKSKEADAQAADLTKALYNERAQAADQFALRTHTQITEQENEQFVPARTVGGGAAMKRPENLVTLTDGTTVQMPNGEEHKDAVKKIQTLDRLQRLNNDIKRIRQETTKLDPVLDMTQYKKNIAMLESMEIDKIDLMSLGKEQGVVKEAEYARAKSSQGMATQGLGVFKGNPVAAQSRDVAEAVIDEQTKRWNADQHAYVRAAGVPIVKKGYVRNAQGQLVPAGQYTGQDVDLPSTLAPRGSKPMDPSKSVPTQGAPLTETTPAAPQFDVPQAAQQTLEKIKGKGSKGPAAHAPLMRKLK